MPGGERGGVQGEDNAVVCHRNRRAVDSAAKGDRAGAIHEQERAASIKHVSASSYSAPALPRHRARVPDFLFTLQATLTVAALTVLPHLLWRRRRWFSGRASSASQCSLLMSSGHRVREEGTAQRQAEPGARHLRAGHGRRGDGVLGLHNFNSYYDTSVKRAQQKLLAQPASQGVVMLDAEINEGLLLENSRSQRLRVRGLQVERALQHPLMLAASVRMLDGAPEPYASSYTALVSAFSPAGRLRTRTASRRSTLRRALPDDAPRLRPTGP